MALLDTFSFVKTFRNASSDEDKAAAIASLVNGLVESNGQAAATRADLARVAGDIVKIEQKVMGLGDELALPVTQKLGETSSNLVKEISALRNQMQERVSLLEAKVDTLNKELGNRVEMSTDKMSSTGRRVIFWNFLLMLLLGIAALFAALNWPMVSAMYQKAMQPAPAATASPAAPATNPPAASGN
jgi:hypothetical protein